MTKPGILFLLVLVIGWEPAEANSRISYSRPGNMIRIPSVDPSMNNKLLEINVSSEYLSSSQSNAGFAVNAMSQNGYLYGISMVNPVNPANSVELGLHVQRNLLEYGNVNLDVGIHDLLFRSGSDSSDGLDTRGISLFGVLSSEKRFSDFAIATHLGFGSGKINEDSHLFDENPGQNLGVFLGFKFTTPLLKKNGGLSFLTEFDGTGLNLGLNIPIFNSYHINFGITHFENFGNFATEDRTITEWEALKGNAPSVNFGVSMNIPRALSAEDVLEEEPRIGDGIYAETDSSILYYEPICVEVVETLRDSIRVNQNIIENLKAHNNMLLHSEAILADSTEKSLFREQTSQLNQNKAMRHLSRSLRFFYSERYRDALSEVNLAIELNPNLAIAYGRRGSIYYKLGDARRATLNWNVALQLDPEFTEIYDILKAAEENRLQPVEIGKKTGD